MQPELSRNAVLVSQFLADHRRRPEQRAAPDHSTGGRGRRRGQSGSCDGRAYPRPARSPRKTSGPGSAYRAVPRAALIWRQPRSACATRLHKANRLRFKLCRKSSLWHRRVPHFSLETPHPKQARLKLLALGKSIAPVPRRSSRRSRAHPEIGRWARGTPGVTAREGDLSERAG